MKRKKCITGIRRKMKIGILTSLAIILYVGISFGYIRFTRGYQVFRAPEHEAAASFGVPDVSDTYQELPVRECRVVFGARVSERAADSKKRYAVCGRIACGFPA